MPYKGLRPNLTFWIETLEREMDYGNTHNHNPYVQKLCVVYNDEIWVKYGFNHAFF